MKKLLVLLGLIITLAACRKEEHIEFPVNNDYGVVLKNVSDGEIMVESRNLSTPMIQLEAGEQSEVLYADKSTIELTWFGKGTYYKNRKKTFALVKNQTTTISLGATSE